MKRSKTLKLLKQQIPKMHARFGILHLALFGSVARDEATNKSDVDILVEFDGDPSFDRFMDLKFYLEDLLHSRVDLVTKSALRPRLVPFLEKELIYVA